MKTINTIFLILIVKYFYMDFITLENLLDKHIAVAENHFGIDFKVNVYKKDDFEAKFYSNKDYIKKDFYGMNYNQITINTNPNDTIESITIHFREVINNRFYNLFTEKYGKPDSILVIKNRQTVSETILKDKDGKINQHLRKNKIDLEEGTFEENPLYIIWKKKNYEIKAFLRHKTGISEITFNTSK